MLRTIDVIDRRLSNIPIKAIVVPAGQSTLVFDPTTIEMPQSEELVYVNIFNAAGNTAYLNLDGDCDPNNNFNCTMAVGQMYELRSRSKVYIYSANGCTISLTVIKRATSAPSNFL